MIGDTTFDVAGEAKRIYEEHLRGMLEQNHLNEFVAIEPISGDYFLASTLSDAIGASRKKHPERLAHALRVGHRAAIHFGLQIQ